MHDMFDTRGGWFGGGGKRDTVVAYALLLVFWLWDNKWAILLGGAGMGTVWLLQ